MAVKSVDGTKKLNIYSSFSLSSDDIHVLSLLYTPLMGNDAFTLYMALSSLIERNNMKSEEIAHQDIYDMYSLTPSAFLKARFKLEGIGLLTVYENDNGDFIYALAPPLTARNFIKDTTIGLYLYQKISKETFDFIYNHFKVEGIDKSSYENITKTFDEVYSSEVNTDVTFEKFKYVLGKKPNKGIIIKDYKFDFEEFKKGINLDYLELGVTKQFEKQISNLAFVYGFDEVEMASLYTDSINRTGVFDYRLLKKAANNLFIYKRNMKAPKLVEKQDNLDDARRELVSYLENTNPAQLLEDAAPNYPESYLKTVNEIYENIDLPRGVLNCMILKVLKDKGGELPVFTYFKKASSSWISAKVFSTEDAIKYVTTYTAPAEVSSYKNEKKDDNGGFTKLC